MLLRAQSGRRWCYTEGRNWRDWVRGERVRGELLVWRQLSWLACRLVLALPLDWPRPSPAGRPHWRSRHSVAAPEAGNVEIQHVASVVDAQDASKIPVLHAAVHRNPGKGAASTRRANARGPHEFTK
jgi:hypothetical protein